MIVPRDGVKGRTYGVRVYRGKIVGFEWIGTFPTRTLAKAAEREALRAPKPKPSTLLCGEYADRWLEQASVKGTTLRSYRNSLSGFKRDFAGVPLAAVGEDDAFDWATRNRWRVTVVRMVFAKAHKRGLIPSDPFAEVELAKSGGRRDKLPLTEAEVRDLADCALRVHGEEFGPVMSAFTMFTAYSGMRPGEVYALDWSDIDIPNREIHVDRRVYAGDVDSPKSNKARVIALAPEAHRALLSLPWTDGLVFRGRRGGRLSGSVMNQSGYVAKDGRTAGVGYWHAVRSEFGRHVHIAELRHFCGHLLYVKRNRPSRVVAVQLGHSTPRLVEQLYGHFKVGALDELKAAFAEPTDTETETQTLAVVSAGAGLQSA